MTTAIAALLKEQKESKRKKKRGHKFGIESKEVAVELVYLN